MRSTGALPSTNGQASLIRTAMNCRLIRAPLKLIRFRIAAKTTRGCWVLDLAPLSCGQNPNCCCTAIFGIHKSAAGWCYPRCQSKPEWSEESRSANSYDGLPGSTFSRFKDVQNAMTKCSPRKARRSPPMAWSDLNGVATCVVTNLRLPKKMMFVCLIGKKIEMSQKYRQLIARGTYSQAARFEVDDKLELGWGLDR